MQIASRQEAEPPSPLASDTDVVAAFTPFPSAAHVAVIGRHTLPFVLALMRQGCSCVRSLRPDAAAPDCETVDLAWIVDVANDRELGDALQAARRRAGNTGRIVLEGAVCETCGGLGLLAASLGLDIVSIDQVTRRALLASAPIRIQTSR
ncbi:MAG: hypothetical protein JOY81_02745 [Alphaproteobacteria bacterium]|nr:hypothetical protein [Alphaproteobacteria bacterium]